MIKFKKNNVNQLFVAPGNYNWNGKAVPFENIDSVIHKSENKIFIVYTKYGKELNVPDEYYERFLKEYRNWLNNKNSGR